jgi:tight adherence protein B
MRRFAPAFVIALLATLLFAVSAFAQGSSVNIRKVLVDGYPNISVTISVPETVAPEDVTVSENGHRADILNIRPLVETGREIDIVLALDTSRSVRGSALAGAVSAAETFVTSLPSEVRVGVLTFSDLPRILQGITADHQSVVRALETIAETQSGTVLYDAIAAAAGMFTGGGQHNIVLLSDGDDVGSRRDLEEALAPAIEKHVSVFTVGLTGPGRRDFPALRTIASRTGASFDPAAGAELGDVYRDLAARLSRQFVVLYHSSAPSGAQVTVEIEADGALDSAVVLMPHLKSPSTTVQPSHPLLSGTVGLAVVTLLSFGAVFLLILLLVGGSTGARRQRELARRMAAPQIAELASEEGASSGPAAWIPQPFVQAAERVAVMGGFQSSLVDRIERAGLALRPGELVAGSLLIGLLTALVGGLAFQSAFLGLALGVLASAIPHIWVSVRMGRRINALHAQLPDVLMILASSMRAGHSFLQSLDTVSKEIGDPGGPEFARVVAEIRLGRPFDEAMLAMADRVGTEEFKWAVMALNVQREVGGNLAEILDILAETVREREAVRRQVKVLSSEGRLSVRILTALPFALVGYVTWINPEYMKLLWTNPLGLILVGVGAVLMVIGWIWARRMTKIDV